MCQGVLPGTPARVAVLTEPQGEGCRGQEYSGGTVLACPLRLPAGAPGAFPAEGPAGCGCEDTPVSRHCPAIKLKVFRAGLEVSHTHVPHSTGNWQVPSREGHKGSLGGVRARVASGAPDRAGKGTSGSGGLSPTPPHSTRPWAGWQRPEGPHCTAAALGGRGAQSPASPTAPQGSHGLQAHHPQGWTSRARRDTPGNPRVRCKGGCSA